MARVQSGPPPSVEGVHVSGTAWSRDFYNTLESYRTGWGAHGPSVSTGSGATIIPWVNVDRMTVRFTQDLLVKPADLRVRGVASTYDVASVETSFDSRSYTTTATFFFADALSRPDNLVVEIDGDPGGIRTRGGTLLDGNGDQMPGGDLVFNVYVLPGDANSGGTVTITDFQSVRRRLGTSATDRDTSPPHYYAFNDMDADGHINVTDLALVSRRMGTYVPPNSAAVAAADASKSVRTRPGARDLFGSTPVLG